MTESNQDLPWTVGRVLNWSSGYFAEKGIDSPKATAEYLLAHTLGCKRLDLYFRYEQPLLPAELATFKQGIKRRIKHEPTQYIVGEWEFWSLPIRVDARVLIPRPETEMLLEQTLQLVDDGTLAATGKFLDLCTGSGAIACALAKELPEATIVATDISNEALQVAQANANALSLAQRIQWQQSDLFEQLSGHSFDAILSNPPYISSPEMEELQPEVRLYEPHLALHGGQDGLAIIQRILQNIRHHLQPGGYFLMEFGASQGSAVQQLAQQTQCFQSVEIYKDFSRRDRILVAQRCV